MVLISVQNGITDDGDQAADQNPCKHIESEMLAQIDSTVSSQGCQRK